MMNRPPPPHPTEGRARLKIFLAGPWWDTGSWTEYIAAGFGRLGHDVRTFIYSRDLNHPLGLCSRLRRKLLGPDRFQIERVFANARQDNLDFIHGVEEFAPDLVLVVKGETLLPETLHAVKRRSGVPLLQWCGDDPFWFPNIVGAFGIYDHFFIADASYIPDIEKHGSPSASFLAHAVDETVYHDGIPPAAEETDVIFVGDSRHQMGHLPENWHRVEMLEAVARAGFNLAIYGRGWESLPDSYAVRKFVRGPELLPATQVAAAYRASAIVLNVHHPQMVHGCNMRTFEAAACGAFQLVDDRASLAELFDPTDDIVAYRSSEELVELIRHHLDHPAERAAIAARGRATVLARHTYAQRLAELLQRATGSAS